MDYSNKKRFYDDLILEQSGLCDQSWLANLANTSALLMANLPDINWSGFYLERSGDLWLGPFQGRPACLKIPAGKGVCGLAAAERRPVFVPDVTVFEGHIACDSRSRSEIVIPMIHGSRLLGVLDVDSEKFDRFDEGDQRGLERLVGELVAHTVWPASFFDEGGTTSGAGRTRPEFIRHWKELLSEDNSHYPGSDELLSYGAALGKKLGLTRIGIHHEVLPPGRRTSWPHAESHEEEFVYVLRGNPHAWIDGVLHPLSPGDAVAFPAGTGIAHTFINNSAAEVHLLVVGEANKTENKCVYPLHPKRNEEIGDFLWKDCPKRDLGPHHGFPDKLND